MDRAETDIPDGGEFDFTEMDSPDADPGHPPGGEPDAGQLWGLRNTEPPVTPGEIGQQLDVHAAWHEHMACGFIKQSSSGGTEAWMHYAMAAMLLVIQLQDRQPVTEEEPEQSSDEPMGPNEFQGPQ